MSQKRCLDLFSGLGGFSSAFRRSQEYDVTTVDIADSFPRSVELDPWGIEVMQVEQPFPPDIQANIRRLQWNDLGTEWDVVLASPVCKGLSLMNVGDNWADDAREPKTEIARDSLEMLRKTIALIDAISPNHWVIENPVGMAKDPLKAYTRLKSGAHLDIITQCQYGRDVQKRTYLAHNLPHFTPRRCSRGDDCHERARRDTRGDDAGTQANDRTPAEKAKLPRELSDALLEAIEHTPADAAEQASLGAYAQAGEGAGP